MTVNANLFTRLSTDATLGALVTNGDSPETFRIYPMAMPQDVTLPAVRYQNISSEPQNTFSGESSQNKDRIQLDAFASTYDAAIILADAIEGAMAVTGNSFKSLRQSRIDLEYDSDIQIYQISIDFSVWYE